VALVTTHKLGKSFGGLDIFAGLSLTIPEGARIAIVGPNGIGKTTLLRVLAGFEPASTGRVHRAKGLTIGYLPQESAVDSEGTLWDQCLGPFAGLIARHDQLARLETEITGQAEAHPSANAEETLNLYGGLQHSFEAAGGYTYELRIRQILAGLGFSEDEWTMPLNHLSGGQRTRALLALLLLEGPNLLILDEPTNHLDTIAVEWLESYIKEWEGAVLIVSHDRYLLDKVCNNIWEMSGAGFETYRGNYSHYLRQRQERWELRAKEFQAEKIRLEKEMDYIKRNIAAQNVAQSRGRLRRMSRKIQAIEQIGLDGMKGKTWLEISDDVQVSTGVMSVEEAEQRLKALKNPLRRPRELKFKLRAGQRGGNIVLRTTALAVGYPGKPLFTAPNIELTRSGCAALIGPNGSGKTTFLKVILDRLPPLEGEVYLGASLEIGYFAQVREDLNPEATLVREIESVAPHMLLPDIRNYLARYLFTGDDVFKKIDILSGGERGRLALAKLALKNANLLLLDEPTNHLDIPSQEMLQNVLAEFDGTIILVSHDRYLIDALATQVWEIDKGRGTLRVFEGTYSEYRGAGSGAGAVGPGSSAGAGAAGTDRTATRSMSSKATAVPKTSAGSEAPEGPLPGDAQLSKRDAYRLARQAKNRELADERRRRARLVEVTARMKELEDDLTRLGHVLTHPPSDRAKIEQAAEEYMRAEVELESLMEEIEGLRRPDDGQDPAR
jgi:ATP-binding cassette subfamily F protein 3